MMMTEGISLQEAQLLPLLNLLGRKSSSCLPRAEGRNANLNNENSKTKRFPTYQTFKELNFQKNICLQDPSVRYVWHVIRLELASALHLYFRVPVPNLAGNGHLLLIHQLARPALLLLLLFVSSPVTSLPVIVTALRKPMINLGLSEVKSKPD